MNISTIPVYVFGQEQNINKATGHWGDPITLHPRLTYVLADGVCTIHEIENNSSRVGLRLPLPFSFPVADLGSGFLGQIALDADQMQATGVCPRWITSMNRPVTMNQLATEYGI